MKIVFEDVLMFVTEDGGSAKIAQIGAKDQPRLYIRVQSWDDTGVHPEVGELSFRKVRITLETVDG